MKRSDKEVFIADFRDRVSRAPVIYLTDFTGIDVKSMTVLRRKVREVGGEYLVVKNRLAERALAELELPDISEFLEGPTGIVLGYGDAVEPARAVTEFAKANGDRPVFKAGVVNRDVLDSSQIERLAKLPPREQLLAQLAGALQAPLAALAGALQAKVQEVAGLLEALRQQREA